MIMLSNVLYIYSYNEKNMTYLLLSRFIFGFGGSKVVHRKYIANYVANPFWTKFYNRLILISFLGMSLGPICYIFVMHLNVDYKFHEQNFVIPGYLGFYIFSGFFLLSVFFFMRNSNESKP